MELVELHQKCIKSGKYPLMPGATQLVPGHGNPHSDIMFIGEAPGADEDAKGIPFVGKAGRVLDELLDSIGLVRSDIYITNMVKCRPPNNRDPEEAEIAQYQAWLDWEIKLIDPKVIIPLGRFALGKFLPGQKISDVHGKVFRRKGKRYFVMYHPAVALYNPSQKQVLLQDFQVLKQIITEDEFEEEDLDEFVSREVEEIRELLNKPPETEPGSDPDGKNFKQGSLF